MGKTWGVIIAIALFILITFLYWKLTSGYAKKHHSKKMWRQWGTQMYYWSGMLFYSGGITVLVIVLLKKVNVLAF